VWGNVDWKGNTIKTQYEGISNKSVGQWKSSLGTDHSEIKILENMLKEEMKAYGYEQYSEPNLSCKLKSYEYAMIMRLKLLRQSMRSYKKHVL
jgi:hypothetical protein